jgi:hypothetical protein
LIKYVKFHKTLEVKIYNVLDSKVGGIPHRRYFSFKDGSKIFKTKVFASGTPARYTA